MIANEIESVADSLWTATANPAPDCPPLQGEAQTDVAVVGAGYAGLSAALHLASAGVSVTVLESHSPGWGASGRNGGSVIAGLKDDPDEIEKHFGAECGRRLVALASTAPALVFNLIAKHDIKCDARPTGWIQPSHDSASLETAQRRVAQWSRRGADMRFLSRGEAADLLGTDAYLGGLYDGRGGNIHPLNFALGLARAAQEAGAHLHGQSPVTRLDRRGEGAVLHTPAGRLTAGRVLICTNGYTDGLAPPLGRSVVPVRSVQVATAPLSDNIRRSILPGGHAASDSRRLLLYFRLDRDGRFVMGGRGTYNEAGTRAQQARLRAASEALFPQLSGVQWDYAWGGYVAMTADHYPHLNVLSPGIAAGLGFNGRGVAMATAMGRVLADWALGMPEAELDFPVTALRPIRFHALRKPAVSVLGAWYRFLDSRG
jgi:glycine/D-amino acid oxidase-like deaminating enzyme